MSVAEILQDSAVQALLIVVAATIWFVWRRRREAAGPLVAAGAFSFLFGSVVFAWAALHLSFVLWKRLSVAASGGRFVYDFRFYSLMLVGVALLVPGFLCAVHARRVVKGDRAAWSRTVWSSLAVIAVSVPLIPIQPGFAPGISFGGLLNVAALLAVRKRLESIGQSVTKGEVSTHSAA